MDPMEFKIARIRAGITQYQIAQEARITPARVSEMETGKRDFSKEVLDALERLSQEGEGP